MYKIMLADDEGIVIDSLKFIIGKEFGGKCIVEYAKTGRSVIELAEKFRPDIAIMDIQMPEMNGLEATRKIRQLDRKDAKEIPIVAMTANAFSEDVSISLEAGMNDHISKPLELKRLYQVLGKYLGTDPKNKE